jgi:gas vesicle protein
VRKKEKMMTAIAMAAEGLELAGELLGTIRRRTAMAQRSAGKMVNNLRDNTADVAEQLVDTVNEKLNRRSSAGARAWQFAAGVGVGVGAALLFAPMPGAKMRETLYKKVTRSNGAKEEMATSDWK